MALPRGQVINLPGTLAGAEGLCITAYIATQEV